MPLQRSRWRWAFWWRELLRRPQLDQEWDAEISCQLHAKSEENISKGTTPEEARLTARTELGGAEQVKERVRAAGKGA